MLDIAKINRRKPTNTEAEPCSSMNSPCVSVPSVASSCSGL